jgi:endonuclease VIII
MPEGDTIYRTAARLGPVLQGRRIEAATGRQPPFDPASLVGRVVTRVEARGKHLLIHVDDGGAVHSHLGMHGAWHVYGPADRWSRPPEQATLILQTGQRWVACFHPQTLELLTATTLRRHPFLRNLGPDLLAPELDETEVLRRFRVHDPTPLGEAVLNQTIVCGLGNVYKSELLFLLRLHPLLPVGRLTDDELRQLLRRARELMRKNLAGYPRRTRFGRDGQRQWVYGRSGEPCLVCGDRIEMRRQGDLGRSTYWCPTCQPARPGVSCSTRAP